MTGKQVEFNSSTFSGKETINHSDRQVLRRLANKVADLASRNIEQEKRRLWTKLNELEPERPLILCNPENGWNEIILQEQLECTGDTARQWEFRLRMEIFWGDSMCDDKVIEPWFNISHVYTQSHWGLREKYTHGGERGSYTWDPPLKDLNDLSALSFPVIKVDKPATEYLLTLAKETFGDLLPVRLRTTWYWTLGLTWELIKLRGLETMMIDMCHNPDGLHNLMAFLRDGTIAMVDCLQEENLYTMNNEGDFVGSGGFGWTKQLPSADFDGNVRPCDLWCLSESQETVGVSPEMFEKFVFQYQLPIVQRFGRVCYGCCEPVHDRWHIIKRIPNLRRVSVSPWCDREKMAANLENNYIYSLKPNPSYLAMSQFDPEIIQSDIRDGLEKAKDCPLEIIMKDNQTICNDPERVVNWIQIAREEIEKFY